MFSSRFHWDFRPNRLTELLTEKRRDGAAVLDLTESNPTHAGLLYPPDMMRAFDSAGAFDYQPAPAGAAAAREAVAAYYAARGYPVAAERILLTASTSEAYWLSFQAAHDPGDDVLVPRPSYPLFDYLATMESIEVRPYPLIYQGGWSIDMEALAAAITSARAPWWWFIPTIRPARS